MLDDASPLLLRLLRDRSTLLRSSSPEAHADALLRGRALEHISRALTAERLDALLVKGAALALTVYPSAAARPMSDIDLLVRCGARDHVVAALLRDGFTAHRLLGRPLSGAALNETVLTVSCGAMPFVVEVHTTLDKIVPHPIGERGLFERSSPAPGLPGLFIPSPEDHALLIALHAAGHEFRHTVGLLDLELLLRSGLDLDVLEARAREWRLGSVMYIAMATLRGLDAASVSDAHVAAFGPGPLRRAVISRCYDVGAYPVVRGALRLGLPWILRQTPLRDDLGAWAIGVARYAALRALERSLASVLRG